MFVWVQGVLLLWWVGQFPGMLSYDSTVYVTEVTTGPWTSKHSVLYDFLVLLSLKISDGVWLLTLLQTTAWALALVYFMRSVQMWGVRARWAAIPAIVLPLLPSFGAFTAMVWKDVGYAWIEVMITATLLRLLRVWPMPPARGFRWLRRDADAVGGSDSGDRRKPPVPWRLLGVLFLEFVGLVMFRNDGFVQLAAMVVVLVLVMRGLRLKVFAAGVAAAILMLLANDVIYPAADIQPPPSSLSYGVFYSDISVVYHWAPHTFTAADRKIMRKIAPLSSWRAGGRDCFNGDLLRLSPHYNTAAADRYRHALAKIWFRVSARTPAAMAKAHLCKAAIAWNPFSLPWPRAGALTIGYSVPDNLFGRANLLTPHWRNALLPRPLVDSIGHATTWARTSADAPFWQFLIWRGATWCYLAYLALIIGARRVRNWRLVFVGGVACLGNQVMVMAANPAQLYRYMVGPIFVGMMLIPLAAAARSPRQRELQPVDDATPGAPSAEPAYEH